MRLFIANLSDSRYSDRHLTLHYLLTNQDKRVINNKLITNYKIIKIKEKMIKIMSMVKYRKLNSKWKVYTLTEDKKRHTKNAQVYKS